MNPKTFIIVIITILVLLILLNYPSFSQIMISNDPPSFEPGIKLQDSNGDIGANPMEMYSVPCVTDWNEDGKKDLLIGTFFGGNILLYLNQGTNSVPVFAASVKIQADGTDLSVGFD